MPPRRYRVLLNWSSLIFLSFSCILALKNNPNSVDLHFASQLFTSLPSVPPKNNETQLLVLLLDSFRWDILDHFTKRANRTLPGFERLIRGGGYVKQIQPVFPAECQPNIVSLLTGLYPAEHGVLFTKMYEERSNQTFGLMEDSFYLHGPEVKTKLAKHGRTHIYHLPFCDSLASEWTTCEPHSQTHMSPKQLKSTLDAALWRLQNGLSNVTVVYYDTLDHVGHRHGPLSDELILSHLPELDHVVDWLLGRLTTGWNQPPHLVLTSDHGMTDVSGATETLDRLLSDYQVKKLINRGSTVSLWPQAGEYEKVLYRLNSPRIRRFEVYSNESIPARWHTGGSLFPPILLVAKPGYLFESRLWPLQLSHSDVTKLKGAHGYDATHPDMHVPLFLFGPLIKPASFIQDSSKDHVFVHRLITSLPLIQPDSHNVGDRNLPQRTSTLQLVNAAAYLFENTTFICAFISVACFLCALMILLLLLFICRSRSHTHYASSDIKENLLCAEEECA